MKRTKKSSQQIYEMVLLAILVAITLVIAIIQQLFPKIGLSLTLLPIPVGIAGVMLGPTAGAVIGLVFGITAFCQCFPVIPIFGMDPVGVELVQLNWFYTVIICIFTRILVGWLVGVIGRGFRSRSNPRKNFSVRDVCGVISAPLLNSVLFLSSLALLFRGTALTINDGSFDVIQNIVIPAISINFVIEIIVCSVVGIAVCAALKRYTSAAKMAR